MGVFLHHIGGSCCSGLQELDLSSNRLATLPGNAFLGVYQLQTLNLADNYFRQIPAVTLQPLNHLSFLDLSDNSDLKTVPNNAFSKNRKLSQLDLSGCILSRIEYRAFESLGEELQTILVFRIL